MTCGNTGSQIFLICARLQQYATQCIVLFNCECPGLQYLQLSLQPDPAVQGFPQPGQAESSQASQKCHDKQLPLGILQAIKIWNASAAS